MPKTGRGVPHPIPEGVNGVLELIDYGTNHAERSLMALCGLLGLRVGEALLVTPADFAVNPGWLRVRGKGDKQRVIPVARSIWQFIEPACKATAPESRLVPMSDRWARGKITQLAETACFSRRVASHDLRATLLTAAYRKSKDLRAVQEIAGHASSVTTEVYTGVAEEQMRAAGEVI